MRRILLTLILILAVMMGRPEASEAVEIFCLEGPTFDIAEFPEVLPYPEKPICGTTENLSGPDRPVHQTFMISKTTLEDFQEIYLKQLLDHGWIFKNPEGSWLGPTRLIKRFEATHPHGYKLQIMMNDLMQKALVAFKHDRGGLERINIKILLKKTA